MRAQGVQFALRRRVLPKDLEAGVPIIEGALAWVVCALRELIAGGDHTIAIGVFRDMQAPMIMKRGARWP